MQTLSMTALLKMELPDGDVRLTGGGWFDFNAERYLEADTTFGSIGSVEAMSEGIGDEIPALQMTLLPPGTSDPADMHQAGMQRSPVQWWLAEYDVDTGLITPGSEDLQFVGQVDQCSLEVDAQERRVAMSHVSDAEKFFERNSGNSLNTLFHEAVFPGELGHRNATGLGKSIAWGTTSPSAGGVAVGGGGSLGGSSVGGWQPLQVSE